MLQDFRQGQPRPPVCVHTLAHSCLVYIISFSSRRQIPSKYALMYDKGVAKLRIHLPNLNEVITPCFLAKKKRFTVTEGIRNRGVASTRYIVEVIYARGKAWRFLDGKVAAQDFGVLNYVWWWSLGFQNLAHKPLKVPAAL